MAALLLDLNLALARSIGFDEDAHHVGVGKEKVVLKAHARIDGYVRAV